MLQNHQDNNNIRAKKILSSFIGKPILLELEAIREVFYIVLCNSSLFIRPIIHFNRPDV